MFFGYIVSGIGLLFGGVFGFRTVLLVFGDTGLFGRCNGLGRGTLGSFDLLVGGFKLFLACDYILLAHRRLLSFSARSISRFESRSAMAARLS